MSELEQPIVLRPHQIQATQNMLRTGRNPTCEAVHGRGVVNRVEMIIASIKDNPDREIEISVTGGSACGDDCQRKQYLKCNSEGILALEREKARRLRLQVGKTYLAKELFETT